MIPSDNTPQPAADLFYYRLFHSRGKKNCPGSSGRKGRPPRLPSEASPGSPGSAPFSIAALPEEYMLSCSPWTHSGPGIPVPVPHLLRPLRLEGISLQYAEGPCPEAPCPTVCRACHGCRNCLSYPGCRNCKDCRKYLPRPGFRNCPTCHRYRNCPGYPYQIHPAGLPAASRPP